MPDYASILRRSVSALPDPSPEMREAVYQRARAALARQLTAVDPPLSTRDIETQHQELEDAVVRLESEFVPQEEPAQGLLDASGKDDFLYTAPQAPRSEPPAAHSAALGDEAPAAPHYEEDEDEFEEEEERSSRVPIFLVGLICLLLVVIGAGAYVYAERQTLFAFLNSAPPTHEVAAVDTAAPPAAAPEVPAGTSPETEKKPDRLVNGTDTPPAEAPPPDANANSAVAEPTTPAPSVQAEAEPPATAAPLETGLGDAATSPEPMGVEQRAIYYYQGSEGQAGQASEGTATWSEITKDDRPAIQATLRI